LSQAWRTTIEIKENQYKGSKIKLTFPNKSFFYKPHTVNKTKPELPRQTALGIPGASTPILIAFQKWLLFNIN
jgi:hypothetical protein